MSRRPRDRSIPRRVTGLILLLLFLAAPPAVAKDLSGFLDFTFADFKAEEQLFGVPVNENHTQAFNRRLYFHYNRRAYPKMRFWLGGTFDDIDVTREIDEVSSDTDQWRLRPFAGIARRSRFWTIQLIWSRDQLHTDNTGLDPRDTTRDSLFGSVNYNPDSEFLPLARLSLNSSYDRDSDKQIRDTSFNTADASVRHQVNPTVRWAYRGSLRESDDRISDIQTKTTSHRAGVAYGDQLWDRRLTLNGRYSINYNELSVISNAGAQVDLPGFPLEGLAARDETPLLITLPPEDALIDDDKVTPTSVNLGLPPIGGDERPWAMGLLLGQGATVNVLFVWIDRDLTREVATSFVWQIYSSEDNLEWMPREVVSTAPFDEFERKFTIRFASITEPYVKVVARPLSADIPGAIDFPEIFVTELGPAERVNTASGRADSSRTSQRALLYARAKLLARQEFYYEGNVESSFGRDQDLRYTMTQGLFYSLPLAPQTNLVSRVAWQETGRGSIRDRDLIYTSTLTTRPAERVSYSLSLTGNNPDFESEPQADRINLFFFGTAGLYEGVDVQLGVGRTWIDSPFGPVVTSDRVQFGSRIQPRQDLIFLLSYTDAVAQTLTGSTEGFQDIFTRLALANVTYTPVPTVYLFAQYRKEWRAEQIPLVSVRWTANWTPFPRASLRVGVNYDESRSDPNVQTYRIITPFLRWKINSLSYFQLVYADVREDTELSRRDSRRFSASLRWGF